MSVFNENGALVYASNNLSMANASLDSIIAESTRMDNILEGMINEAIGQINAADIVLESVGYYNESVKEVLKNGWAKMLEGIKKFLDNALNFIESLAPSKKIILINKKKITDKFNDVKNNEALKSVIKEYNSVSEIDSKTLIDNIDVAFAKNKKIMQTGSLSSIDYIGEIGNAVGIELTKNWKQEILDSIGPKPSPSEDPSSINISDVITTATSMDKNIPAIKQRLREVDKMIKDINNGDYIPDNYESANEDAKSAKFGLPIISFYCTTALKSIKILAGSSVKLCMAVLKYKEPKNKDAKSNNSDTEEE